MLEGTNREGVHAVDVGLMANESLASESNGNVFVGGGYHTFVFGSGISRFSCRSSGI